MKKILNLHYSSDIELERKLSNLYPYIFIVDGVKVKSMEGFLQSLKTNNLKDKEKLWKMHGIECWKYGQKFNNWKESQKLHYQGKEIDRHSNEYSDIVERAYECLFDNEEFKNNLKESLNYKLTHKMGSTDKYNSILTKEEYINNLEGLRNRLKEKRFFNLFGF